MNKEATQRLIQKLEEIVQGPPFRVRPRIQVFIDELKVYEGKFEKTVEADTKVQ